MTEWELLKKVSVSFFLGFFWLGGNLYSQTKKTDAIKQVTIRPGEVLLLKFPVLDSIKDGEIVCGDQRFKHEIKNGEVTAYISESYFSEFVSKECAWKSKIDPLLSHALVKLKVKTKKFPQEFLKVDSKKVQLSDKDFERAKEEQEILNLIFAKSSDELLFNGPFQKPLKSTITSYYGIQRVYNKVKKGQHLGTDFRAPIGHAVPAANRGKVVMAQDLFFSGKTVIIDHGLEIFTIYGHLSEFQVKVNDMVEAGQILAKSGNPGRSSGPHLHWGVKVGNNFVDGLQLVELTTKEYGHGRKKPTSASQGIQSAHSN
jgi:murein DD-endopeptidase MepM/ murein hydrolase activator NlpD